MTVDTAKQYGVHYAMQHVRVRYQVQYTVNQYHFQKCCEELALHSATTTITSVIILCVLVDCVRRTLQVYSLWTSAVKQWVAISHTIDPGNSKGVPTGILELVRPGQTFLRSSPSLAMLCHHSLKDEDSSANRRSTSTAVPYSLSVKTAATSQLLHRCGGILYIGYLDFL